jgi:hypothetical protein
MTQLHRVWKHTTHERQPMNWLRGAATVCLFAAVSSSLHAQQQERLRIAVAIDDDSIGGVLSSAFRGALRSLGDVDIVLSAEDPDWILEGSFLCTPGCIDVTEVSGSIRLIYPLSKTDVSRDLRTVGIRAPDSIVTKLAGMLARFQYTRAAWTVKWGKARFTEAPRAFVARLDAQCFEPHRVFTRIIAMPEGPVKHAATDAWLKIDTC